MFKLEDMIDVSPFSLQKQEKEKIFTECLNQLTQYHYENCPPYHRILDMLHFNLIIEYLIGDMPFFPVRLFKDYELVSINKDQIIKTMTSSGTSGQKVSKIFLDKFTAANQIKVLAKIVSDFIGPKRLPLLIIDSKSIVKDRLLFSARGAGVLGFAMFGTDVTYALDENMKLDHEVLEKFCQKYNGQKVLVFGFTQMVWQYFYRQLVDSGKKIDLSKGILIHGGGWKKLIDQAVDNNIFKQSIEKISGIKKVHNYYGMVEQTGSIFMECEEGFLHSSIFSDVLIRRTDFSLGDNLEKGMIQLISLLPSSYPGHSILSEDIGEIFGEDDCPCGRLGKYFKVHGRIKNAEIRGCSDTHDQK